MSTTPKFDLEAPVFGPLAAYHRPLDAPFHLGVDTVSVAELKNAPEAWAVVLRHAPSLNAVVSSADAKSYLGEMTLGSFITFGQISQAQVEQINADLVRLAPSQWPKV